MPFRFRTLDYPALNAVSTAVSFALPATLGSGISVAYHASAAWCIFEIVSRRRGLSSDRPMLAVAALLCAYCAIDVLAFAVNGVGMKYGDQFPLFTLLVMPFIYSVLSVSRKEEVATGAALGSMLAVFAAAGIALFDFYIGHRRAEGITGNPLVFAEVTSLAGSLCAAGLFLSIGSPKLRGWLAGAVAASLVAVLLSGSRSSWIALPVCVLVSLTMGLSSRSFAPSLRGLLLAAGFLAVLAALAAAPVSARLAALASDWDRLEQGGGGESSLGVRLRLWRLGLELFREHPLIGYGTPSSKPLIHAETAGRLGMPETFSHFHNGFVTAAVETGVLGLAALLGVLLIAAWTAVWALGGSPTPAERLGAAMLAILVVNTAITGSFNIIIGHDILDAVFMGWLLTGLFLASGTAIPDPPPPAPSGRTAG